MGGEPEAVRTANASARLTPREREILGLLAEGMSGARIAQELVLSPETVRTHIRNARSKLGAATRSQAVAMAVHQQDVADHLSGTNAGAGPRAEPERVDAALAGLAERLRTLHDIDHACAYIAEVDGLSLRRGASPTGVQGLPQAVVLGDGVLGRAALERRVQIGPGGSNGDGNLIATPIVGRGRLLGLIALQARSSRPLGRNELLLLRVFADRVGEVLVVGREVERSLERTAQRFFASWTASVRSG